MERWAARWGNEIQHLQVPRPTHGQDKCCCDYTLKGQVLVKVNSERDIGVQVSGDLKVSQQCAKAARTAMGVLVQILRAFSYRDKRVLPRLYVHVQYVRPPRLCSASLATMAKRRH